MDKDFTIIDVGESCLCISAYSAAELQGASLDKLFPPDAIHAVREAICVAFSGRTTSVDCNVVNRCGSRDRVQLIVCGAVTSGAGTTGVVTAGAGTSGAVEPGTATAGTAMADAVRAGALRTVRMYVREDKSGAPDRRIVPNMIATRVPLPVILYELASALESEYPQYIACITYDHPDTDEFLHIETTRMPMPPDLNGAVSDSRPVHCLPALERRGTHDNAIVTAKDIKKEGACSACAWLKTEYGKSVCWSRAMLTPYGESLGRFSVYGPEDATKGDTSKEDASKEDATKTDTSVEEIFILYSAMAELAMWSNYYEAYLVHKDERDELTDLYNYRKFTSILTAVAKASEQTTLLYIDVDNFEFVNQGTGHNVGNRVLKAVAKRLQQWSESTYIPGRISGDAFGVILPDVPLGTALNLAEEITDIVREPIQTDQGPVYITVSIGVSIGNRPEELMSKAFQGALEAKRIGGDTASFFNEYRDAASLRLFELMRDIHTALDKGQLDVHYQPRVDARTNEMVAAEALLRWHHPDWGTIPPGEFIAMLEQHGLMSSIEQWIVERVCQDLQVWSNQGLKLIPISINFCPQQLMKPDVVEFMTSMLDQYGLDASLLEVELTERQTLPPKQKVTQVFQQFKNAGIRILLDDFAGGATPLSYFNRTLVSAIKVEKDMTDELLTNEDAVLVLSSLIDLTHKLGIRVIAEGVENERQADLLVHMHCDEIQGYLYSPPVPATTFASMLRKSRMCSDDVAGVGAGVAAGVGAGVAAGVGAGAVAGAAIGLDGNDESREIGSFDAASDRRVAGLSDRVGGALAHGVLCDGALSDGADRRRRPRINLPAPLIGRITISRIQHRQVKVGWSAILVSNISPEGVEFASTLRLPAHRHTVLRIQLNVFGEFEVSANLLWMHEHEAGIFKYGAAFVMTGADRSPIEHLCTSLAEKTAMNQVLPKGSIYTGNLASFFHICAEELRDEG